MRARELDSNKRQGTDSNGEMLAESRTPSPVAMASALPFLPGLIAFDDEDVEG